MENGIKSGKWLASEYKYPSGGIIIIGIEKILATERCYHATRCLLITFHNISHYPGNYILRWLNVRKSTTRETEASSTTPVNCLSFVGHPVDDYISIRIRSSTGIHHLRDAFGGQSQQGIKRPQQWCTRHRVAAFRSRRTLRQIKITRIHAGTGWQRPNYLLARKRRISSRRNLYLFSLSRLSDTTTDVERKASHRRKSQ